MPKKFSMIFGCSLWKIRFCEHGSAEVAAFEEKWITFSKHSQQLKHEWMSSLTSNKFQKFNNDDDGGCSRHLSNLFFFCFCTYSYWWHSIILLAVQNFSESSTVNETKKKLINKSKIERIEHFEFNSNQFVN